MIHHNRRQTTDTTNCNIKWHIIEQISPVKCQRIDTAYY